VIGIENLGVLKNHKLARAIADVGFSEFRRQLTYKAEQAGVVLHVVSRWEPTSKTCSCCGWYKADLTLAERIFRCCACGLVIDRDENAARNLAPLALKVQVSDNGTGKANRHIASTSNSARRGD
jgi:putative transposase